MNEDSYITEAHPVAATFVKNAVLNGAQLIVVDPRRHPLVDLAHLHVPIRVGSDIALLNGLMHVLIQEGLYDKDGKFTCGLGVFNPVDWAPPAEVPDDQYPFVLSTGRRLTHYHTRTQTGRCQGLDDILGEETADISVEDANSLGIQTG